MGPSIEQRFPRPSVMGVVNVTPDSFSDGGVNLDPGDAVATARRMVEEGAAIVDVGGESTRPGAGGVSADEELRRVEATASAGSRLTPPSENESGVTLTTPITDGRGKRCSIGCRIRR